MNGTSLSPDGLRDLSRRAAFVFQGEVQAVGRSNLEGVPPDERMALVRINDVILAPPLLGDLIGQTITVYLDAERGAKPKDTAIFFATSWHYGKTIGVIEIGRTATTADSLRQALGRLSVKEAVAEIAAISGRPRREVYQRALALAKGSDHDSQR